MYQWQWHSPHVYHSFRQKWKPTSSSYLNWTSFPNIYRPQRSWGKVIFSEACVNNSVQGGRAWLPGGGACVVLFGGACMVLFGGTCVVLFRGGMCGFIWGGMRGFIRGGMRGFIQWGGMRGFIQWGGMHGFIQWGGGVRGFFSFSGYNEIRSMSGRYASYWNAFLLTFLLSTTPDSVYQLWN